jgi:hypothetical protein
VRGAWWGEEGARRGRARWRWRGQGNTWLTSRSGNRPSAKPIAKSRNPRVKKTVKSRGGGRKNGKGQKVDELQWRKPSRKKVEPAGGARA